MITKKTLAVGNNTILDLIMSDRDIVSFEVKLPVLLTTKANKPNFREQDYPEIRERLSQLLHEDLGGIPETNKAVDNLCHNIQMKIGKVVKTFGIPDKILTNHSVRNKLPPYIIQLIRMKKRESKRYTRLGTDDINAGL